MAKKKPVAEFCSVCGSLSHNSNFHVVVLEVYSEAERELMTFLDENSDAGSIINIGGVFCVETDENCDNSGITGKPIPTSLIFVILQYIILMTRLEYDLKDFCQEIVRVLEDKNGWGGVDGSGGSIH